MKMATNTRNFPFQKRRRGLRPQRKVRQKEKEKSSTIRDARTLTILTIRIARGAITAEKIPKSLVHAARKTEKEAVRAINMMMETAHVPRARLRSRSRTPRHSCSRDASNNQIATTGKATSTARMWPVGEPTR